MGFLWQLLPGAREARNQILVGYVWVAAAALWIGVPQPVPDTRLEELADAIGPIGLGVAVSFLAFLVGSLSGDLVEGWLKIRGARALTRRSDVPAFMLITRMDEPVRAELSRLEALIDQGHGEVTLRVGLIPPVALGAIGGAIQGGAIWLWAVGAMLTIGAIAFQFVRRLRSLRADIASSTDLRDGMEESIIPEALAALQEARERREQLSAERVAEQAGAEADRQAEAALTDSSALVAERAERARALSEEADRAAARLAASHAELDHLRAQQVESQAVLKDAEARAAQLHAEIAAERAELDRLRSASRSVDLAFGPMMINGEMLSNSDEVVERLTREERRREQREDGARSGQPGFDD